MGSARQISSDFGIYDRFEDRGSALRIPRASKLARFYFVLNALISFVLIFRIVHHDRNWTTADWLINYQGGFVRRGLFGEIILQLHRLSGVSVTPILIAMLLLLQSCLLAGWYRLKTRASSQGWVLAILISPATLSFALLDYEGGFHKEIFLLAAFVMLLPVLKSNRVSDPVKSALIGITIVTAVLCHEAAIFFVPYFVAALACSYSLRRAIKISVAPIAVAFVAAFFSAIHRGSEDVAAKICSSLGYTLNQAAPHEVCDHGAISYLTTSTTRAFHDTMGVIRTHNGLKLYSVLAVLSVLPLVWGSTKLAKTSVRRPLAICWAAGMISFVLSIGLFLLGFDWGRWIHLHVMFLGALLLVLEERRLKHVACDREFCTASAQRPSWPVIAIVFIYATSWMLPVDYISQPLQGYYGTMKQLASSAGVHLPRTGWLRHSA